jgi:uncharacterized protein DUF4255
MSNALAIAAITTTLKSLISVALGGPAVTVKTPDKAAGSTVDSLNLFLYHVVPSTAWRNQAMQGYARPGETGQPALGLNLYYVLSACSADDDEATAHRLLGMAMSALHDHPLLSPSEITAAVLGTGLEESGVDLQVERVRITLQPLSIEDMYKLWSAFQTSYRVSAAYEISVVLIESTRPTKAPLPVLRAGPLPSSLGDPPGGPIVQSDLAAFPVIFELDAPYDRSSALQGSTLAITGRYLSGDLVEVAVNHRLWPTPLTLTAATATDTKVTFGVPTDPDAWPPGLYTLTVLVTTGAKTRSTNDLVFSLAAALVVIPPSPPDPLSLQLDFDPKVWPGQRLSVIVGSHEIRIPGVTAKTGTLTVPVNGVTPGSYYVRLRVDGIDSQLLDTSSLSPQFDPALKVTLP